MRFDRRLLTHFEWLLPLLALAVCGLGAATVYSATHVPGTQGLASLALRQLLRLAGGVGAMLPGAAFDRRRPGRSRLPGRGALPARLLPAPARRRAGVRRPR